MRGCAPPAQAVPSVETRVAAESSRSWLFAQGAGADEATTGCGGRARGSGVMRAACRAG